MKARRVAIVSPVDDRLNTNAGLRDHVAEGFATVCGAGNVASVAERASLRAIEEQRPELIVVFGGLMPDAVDLRALRRAADRCGAHVAVWLHDDPYELDFAYRALDAADTIFTNDLASLDYYLHRPAYHLPLAASPTAHFRELADEFEYDLFFCGYGFANRIVFFNDLDDADLAPYRTLVAGEGWPERSLFTNRRIPSDRLPDFYAASLCTVALGRDLDLGNARYQVSPSTPGPRVFEAAMAGCAQLHFTTGLEIERYFEPGRQIVLIDRPSEATDWMTNFITDRTAHHRLRKAAQTRALRDHTYAARATTMLERCFPSA